MRSDEDIFNYLRSHFKEIDQSTYVAVIEEVKFIIQLKYLNRRIENIVIYAELSGENFTEHIDILNIIFSKISLEEFFTAKLHAIKNDLKEINN